MQTTDYCDSSLYFFSLLCGVWSSFIIAKLLLGADATKSSNWTLAMVRHS
jgi:hypothetical protein